MWKKILVSFVFIILILAGLYALRNNYADMPNTERQPQSQTVTTDFDRQMFTYQAENLPQECQIESQMACAVDFAVKCTLNPNFNGCRQSRLPKFIFMEDEYLQRPTEISFKITKIKPVSAEMAEIHTQSECDGNWFGLCQGTVIYVLVPENDGWRVKDIYAVEN